MKNKEGNVIVIVLVVLVVIIFVGVIGLLYVKNLQMSVQQTKVQSPTVLTTPTKSVVPSAVAQPSATDENIVKELLEREHGLNSIKNITSLQSAAGYMRGEFDTVPSKEDAEVGRDTGGGGIFLAVNINDIWKLVFAGNGQLECKLVKPYNFPDSMISDCVDF